MTDAQKFEGKWVLEGTVKGEGAILVVDHYGLRIVWGFHDGEGVMRIPSHQGFPPYLTGEALVHLRKLTEGVWECPDCRHWAKGEGFCPWCGKEQHD